MSTTHVNLRFDGIALQNHTIDVAILAPALVAFGELFKEANRILNHKRTTIKVMVNADIKANCVTLSLEIAQQVWDSVKTLLKDDNVVSAKELLDWLLIGATGLSVLGLIKLKVGNKIENVTTITENNENSIIQININGNGNQVDVNPRVLQLYQEPTILKAIQEIISPLVKDEGITEATFLAQDHKIEVSQEEAREIYSLSNKEPEEGLEPQKLIGHIVIHSPHFDMRSRIWDFDYNGNIESIDIGDTTIAEDILKRGKVIVGDTYKVELEITEKKQKTGYKNFYKVTKVLDFKEGNEQLGMELWEKSRAKEQNK